MKTLNEYSLDELREHYLNCRRDILSIRDKAEFSPYHSISYSVQDLCGYQSIGNGFHMEEGKVLFKVNVPVFERNQYTSKHFKDGYLFREVKTEDNGKSIQSCNLYSCCSHLLRVLAYDYNQALDRHPEYGQIKRNLDQEIERLAKQKEELCNRAFEGEAKELSNELF